MNKVSLIKQLLAGKNQKPVIETAHAFAPSNIALVKYWGKRDIELNLPITSSLSISLADKGARTSVSLSEQSQDIISINGQIASFESQFAQRLISYIDLFRPTSTTRYHIETKVNIPIAAGLASSACGFAALIKAFDQFYGWHLPDEILSILARIGSGSASRSIYEGFVQWHRGERSDGLDSYSEPLPYSWPEIRLGLMIFDNKQKSLGSTAAMQHTVKTSKLYETWPKIVSHDMEAIQQAISLQDFTLLGETAEHNALSMHATMLSSWPPICYSNQDTIAAMHKIWQLRSEGLALYFTQDAGPNLKLLFQKKDETLVKSTFANIEVICPF